jgi:hypothetical protein
MSASIKRFFYSINLMGNRLLNAKVTTPTDDEHIANKAYVDSKSGFITISSLSKLATELPVANRYKGLIFLVSDATTSNGSTTDGTVGKLYVFESNITTPVLLSDVSLQYIIHQVTNSAEDYYNFVDLLNQTYSKVGNIITIMPLGITVIYDGNLVWRYLTGTFKVSSEDVYNDIPQSLLKVGATVIINSTTEKIILSDYTLSDPVIVVDSLPTSLENWRYYSVNGVLYYVIGGVAYLMNDKISIITQTLSSGNNEITHTLNSDFILCYMKILISDNLEITNKTIIIPDYNIVSNSKINIKCSFDSVSTEIILLSKK